MEQKTLHQLDDKKEGCQSCQTSKSQRQMSPDKVQKGEYFIGDCRKAPPFMLDNGFIEQGYRINFKSIPQLCKSLFMIHNESVNIWCHLLPLIVFAGLLISFMMVIDDHEFKQTLIGYKQDFEKSFQEYHTTFNNLPCLQNFETYSEQTKAEIEQIKVKIVSKYYQIMAVVQQKSKQLDSLLNENIEGLKISLKEDLRKRINDLEDYKYHYEMTIAPFIVNTVYNNLDTQFFNQIKMNAESLKRFLDSNIFEPMELRPESPNPQLISRWPIFLFMITAVLCLLFSTAFHLFHPLSSKAYGLLLRFDFAGISLLIAGSGFPPLYYGMYCHFAVAEIYLTCTVVAATICFIVGLFEWIHKRENMRAREFLFGAFGLSLLIPLFHLVVNEFVFDNFGDPFRFSSSYIYYIGLATSYITGLYIFSKKCPERNHPGKYDICGQSHQIWHFLVVIGIIFTYFGALENFEMRKQSICPI